MARPRFWGLLLLGGLLLVLSGCGARVEQTIYIDPDGSGKITVVGTDDLSDVNQVKGGLDAVKQALEDKVPTGWTLNVTNKDGVVTFDAEAQFANADDLRHRIAAVTGVDDAVTLTATQTPLWRHRQLIAKAAQTAWAKWAVDAVATLSTDPAIESVQSFVVWPGQERKPLWNQSSADDMVGINRVGIALTWSPATGATRDIYILPDKAQPLFMDFTAWLRPQFSGGTVTGPDDQGGYHIVLPTLTAPWGPSASVTSTRQSMFWNRVVIAEPAPQLGPWLGAQVPIAQTTYSLSAAGWWGITDQGPPKWYRFPRHSTDLQGLDPSGRPLQLVGYYPRLALYVAWVGVPVIAVLALVGVVLGLRRRPLRSWLAAAGKLGGIVTMSVSPRPMFCQACGQALNGADRCSCGQVARLMATSPVQRMQVDAWGREWVRRLAAIFRLEAPAPQASWQVTVFSIVLRALILALVVDRWANALVGSVLGTVTRSIPFIGLMGAPSAKVAVFWPMTLGYLLAAGCGLLISYFALGRDQFTAGAGVLSDSQWPVVAGILAAWLLSHVWLPLAVIAFVGSVAWGQAILAVGLGSLPVDLRKRLLAQAGLSGVTAAVVLMVLGSHLQHLLSA